MTRRLIALLILTVSILTACGRANATTHPAAAGYLIFLEGGFSNDGKSVYLIQKMIEPNHYRVRLYDVAAGALMPQPVVDKREPNEPMNGIRGDSVADPAGNHVYTVYIRDAGPFIHALPLSQPFAFCVDLPPSTHANDIEMQFHCSLAVSRDGCSLYTI